MIYGERKGRKGGKDEEKRRKRRRIKKGDEPMENTKLYQRLLSHMKSRMLFASDLAPAPICSIGSVIANRRQSEAPFHWVMGNDEDLGLNVCLVAPSGFAKSYTMKQFLHRTKGICPFKSTFRGKITEAGFIGTISKEGEMIRGDAYLYSDGIIAFNEITNLFFTQQSEHSGELINQVMEALTERRVSKRLSNGVIEYPTLVTIWGGIQPRRFDFSQGLGRRFLFICRNWSEEDMKALKSIRLNRDDVIRLDMKEVSELRSEIDIAKSTFKASEIKWDQSILQYIRDMSESHLQMQTMERAIIGKETLNQYNSDTMVIQDTEENKSLIDHFSAMQTMVAEGSDISLMINVLKSNNGKPTPMGDLWDIFRTYNYSLPVFQDLITTCIKLRVIKCTYKGGRQMVSLREDILADRIVMNDILSDDTDFDSGDDINAEDILHDFKH